MLVHFLRKCNINRIFLSHIGFRPFQSKLRRKLLLVLYLLFEISYCPFEILIWYDHRDNTQMMFESCYQLAVSSVFIVKIINYLWNYDELRRLYETIDNHWNIFTSDMEVRILKNYSFISRKFTIFYSTLIYFMLSTFIIIPLTPAFLDIVLPLNESRPRTFAIEVEFRVDKNEYFILIFSYTTVIIVTGISIMVDVDTMHITCTTHACSLFSIVGQQIENITLKIDDNDKINERGCRENRELKLLNEEIIYQEYIICLKKHQLAIEFVNILNSSYQMLALSLLLLIIAVLSLIGVRIVYVMGQVEEMTRFVFIIMGALMQLMIVCYSSQKLMDESQNIFHRAYAADWYNSSPRIKSLLIIILYRSIVSCGLTAGNMFPLSMATYTAVVRMGMSYFTAFLSIKE